MMLRRSLLILSVLLAVSLQPASARELIDPGRASAVAGVPMTVYIIRWADYQSILVIEPGDGLRRQAWLVTIERTSQTMVVSYAGHAFRGEDQRLHIDCQRAALNRGRDAHQWSPDSLAINDDDTVVLMDDNGNSSKGVVEIKMSGDHPQYQQILAQVRFQVTGIL